MIHSDGSWHEVWNSRVAPAVWRGGDPHVARALAWESHGPALRHAELRLSGAGEARRLRVIVVELDPTQFRAGLSFGKGRDGYRTRVDRIPTDAVLLVNTGMFEGTRPWGWILYDNSDRQPPRRAPLAISLAFDSTGRPHWIDNGAARPVGYFSAGFQSYPVLLRRDTIPASLLPMGRGVRPGHRDARLAVGTTRDGRLLFVLTRLDILGDTLGRIPVGLTLPELAALMGMLGCETAVGLDGGISAQLAFRDAGGAIHAWPGLRAVPMLLRFDPHPSNGAP